MKKPLKITLKIVLSVVIILIIAAAALAIYFNRSILNIDGIDPLEVVEIKTITIDGVTFLDRNGNGKLDIYEDTSKTLEERADDLISQMTIEEKIVILKGSGMKSGMGFGDVNKGVSGAVGTTVPIARLGIPTVFLSDGPAGLRINPTRGDDPNTYYCTAFPIGTMLASTWNTELVHQVGESMGNEALEYGIDVILGPGANIHRSPLNGRNFEYYSEDPVLTGKIGAAIVNGIESNGVGTSVKHFAANSQETARNYNDVRISERALREIYLKGFEIIVKEAQPWTIMSSYNKVNGTYTSESRELLTDILRGEWNFKGLVMSDWFGGENASAQIHAGNDLLEPGTRNQFNSLKEASQEGTLSEEDINTSVKRILKMILNSKKMEQYAYSNTPDLKGHAQVTRQSAAEGMILLKNEGVLPLENVKNVALFGVTSYNFIAGGAGSGFVNVAYTVSLEEGLKNAGFEINKSGIDAFEAHKSANSKFFKKKEGLAAMMDASTPPEMLPSEDVLDGAKKDSEVAIITIGRNSGEGKDRVEENDFNLSETEINMISTVCEKFHAEGKKVIVVLNIGGVIETASWKEKPDAILLAWQGGQEGGNSVADVLKGTVNPSGKLPMTFPILLTDHASTANFPLDGEPMSFSNMLFGIEEKPENEKIKNKDFTNFEEGIYVGYRHFDKNNIQVSYPFGYGLSYTKFELSNMNTLVSGDSISIQVTVKNVGQVAGKEVVQLYTSKQGSIVDRPVHELKGFAKTPLLSPMDSTQVNILMSVSDLAYWDETSGTWAIEQGGYTIFAGTSSRALLLESEVNVPKF